ncbi:MAG: FG-GAP-like repeat-containing protein [Anaerolineales bacterium]
MRRMLTLGGVLIAGLALLLQQGLLAPPGQASLAPVPQTNLFTDVSRKAGVTNNRVVSLELAIGQAWGDYDNDGWVDLYVTDPAGPNTLYRNNGDGTFALSPLKEQVALPQAYSAGATFVDFDNDGWRDLFVANWGLKTLFRNEGGKRFVNITEQAGIRDTGNSKSASWGDFDNDGFLDLYIANWSCYPKCGRPMEGDVDRLYHNNGDGTFSDVSSYLGGSLNGAGFIASFNDYDNDGDTDLYLVNDEFINGIGNKLWRNDGSGCGGKQSLPQENREAVLSRPLSGREGWCFTQVAREAGADSRLFGMGLAVGDYDNDGDLDYYYSNVGPMELLQNQGDGTFREVADAAGVQTPNAIGWGAVFFDYDNDGWRDLYLAVADTTNHKDIAANQLFRNNADGTFTEVVCSNEASDVRPSLGVAYADYDRDGWVDLAVGNMDEGYRLYRNQSGQTATNHWLSLELVGAGRVNRDAVGARVYVSTTDGPQQMQDVINGSSLGAGNELAQYFGLGAAERATVAIRWPDGAQQTFENVAADQRYRLQYGTAELVVVDAKQVVATSVVPAFNFQFTPSVMWAGLAVGLVIAASLALTLSARVGWAVFGAGVLSLAVAGYFAAEPFLPTDIDTRLSRLMTQAGVRPPTHPPTPLPELVKLGEALFWDPELSGNRDISCATCHHAFKATGDNLSLSIGTGGEGLGELRIRFEERREFIPRNAQPLFNLGYQEWEVLFWDGRVNGTLETGFNSPASDRLPSSLDNLLAAQAMFPVTSRDEMRGLRGDKDIFGNTNELAMLVDYAARPIWKALMKRLLAISGYVELFRAAYPDVPTDQLGFQHAANGLAAYEIAVFTFEDSPFDRYIQGDRTALSSEAKRGAELFYGEAGCATCHTGGLLTDQKFHNIAVPQIGDGKGREQPFDLGRARETGNDCDRYAFRTPPLRNVAATGPWMHNGALLTLEAVIRHHQSPATSLQNYDPSQLSVLLKESCQDAPEVIAAILATQSDSATERVQLSEAEMQDLIAFLESLTAPSALDLAHTIPPSVPSGLQVGGRIGNPASNVPGNTMVSARP